MPVVYGGMHSVMFIRLNDSTARHSWSDLHLIPETRPTIVLPEPKVQLIEIPGRSKRIDLTDYMPGGLIYGPRSGEFTFYVDHDQWDGWKNAYNELSKLFNGDKFAVYLMDNITELYEGRVYLTEYTPGEAYSSAVLHYELEPDIVTDGYIRATFKDSSTYGGTVLQESMLKRNTMPKYHGVLPQHPGYKFNYWTPSLSTISSSTTYTAVYRAVQSYTINFVDWDGTVLKSSVVNEEVKPTPPSYPVRIGYRFIDWDSEIVEANADKTYTAVYFKDENYINGVWEEVEKHLRDGSYKTYYHVGDVVYLNIDDEYNDYAEIVAIDKDIKSIDSEDTRVMPLTFITKKTLVTEKKYNETAESSLYTYRNSDLRRYVQSLYSLMPSALQNILMSTFKFVKTSPMIDTLWIPSEREIFGGTDYGVTYDDFFVDSESRVKTDNSGNRVSWWLRDYGSRSGSRNYYNYVTSSGNANGTPSASENTLLNVVIGFSVCIPSSIKYLITFYDSYNGGTLKKYWADYNSTPVPPSNPSREGYVFDGWGELTPVTDDTEYMAQYKRICTIIFNDYDGTQLLEYTIIAGNKPNRFPATPTREGYVFSAWSPSTDSNVYSDKTYTAQYKKLYTITFMDYDGTRIGSYQVPEGDTPEAPTTPERVGYAFDHWNPSISSASEDIVYTAEYRKLYRIIFKDYTGSTLKDYWAEFNSYPSAPSNPTRTGYTFTNWSPSLAYVSENATYVAEYVRNPATLSDTWDDVDARIADGTYSSYYVVGDKIALTIGSYYDDYAQIAGIDTDTDANGNAIPLTFITANCLNSTHNMNSSDTNKNGYPSSSLYTYVKGRKSSFPTKARNMIVAATKTSRKWDGSVYSDLTTSMELWTPSFRELGGTTTIERSEESGPIYSGLPNRVKEINGSATGWWTRSMYSYASYKDTDYTYVLSTGQLSGHGLQSSAYGVAIGFCVGGTASAYTVKFADYDGTVLQESSVNKGTVPTAPEVPTRVGYLFNGWDSEITAVTSGKTYTATYVLDPNYAWNQVKSRIDNGTYNDYYSIGDKVYLKIGNEYDGYAIVAGIDTDTDENGNTIPMTFITADALATTRQMNSSNTASGGYQASAMKTYVDNLETSLPSVLQTMIVPALKTSRDYNSGSRRDLSNAMKLWIPSSREVLGESSTYYEQTGPIYNQIFNNIESRIKRLNNGNNDASNWWLRSAAYSTDFRFVYSTGGSSYAYASNSYGVVIGFCVGGTTT